MATLKAKEIEKLSKDEREKRLKDLKMELIKSKATAKQGKGNVREIKKIIARILTINASNKSGELNKK